MHILHVIDSLAVGGSERMAVDLANATLKQGHKVSLCVTRSETTLATDLDPDIQLFVLHRQKRFDWGAMGRMRQFIREQQPDVLHAHHRTTVSLLAFMKILGWLSPPIVMHDHYGVLLDASMPRWLKWGGRFVVRQYVGVYDEHLGWIQAAKLPTDSVQIIPNHLDLSRFSHSQLLDIRTQFDLPTDLIVGVVVGGIRYEKGTDRLIEMFTQLPHTENTELVFVGASRDAGYFQTCRHLASKNPHIHFVGEFPQVQQLLPSADFALMPSRSETGPLVLIEYALAGLPFVAYRVGNISQHMAQVGIEGLVEADNEQAFQDELLKLLALSPYERQQRGKRGTSIATELFDIHKVIPQWLAVYQKAVR